MVFTFKADIEFLLCVSSASVPLLWELLLLPAEDPFKQVLGPCDVEVV